jgi:hypothetical protein
VPWDQLTLQSGADETTAAEGQNVFVLNGDQQMLENAPEIDLNAIPGVDEPVEGWDTEFDNYWTTGGMTNTTTTQTPGAAGSDTSTTTPEAGTGSVITGTAQAPGAMEDMQDNRLSQLILASELLDRDISLEAQGSGLEGTGTITGTGTMTDTQGTGMETTDVQLIVRDAIVDPADGTIQYFIVVASGLGDDDMWVPVPPDLLVEDDGDNMRFSAINPEALAGVPAFTEDEFPNTNVEGWDDALVDWWNTHMDLTTP